MENLIAAQHNLPKPFFLNIIFIRRHDSRSSSRNSNRTPMTEYQQKAQKAFGVSPLASPIIAKHERAPEVTGIQLIQPQTASDVRGKTAVGNKHGKGTASTRI